MHHMQELRKQLLNKICEGGKETFSEVKHSLEDVSQKELDNVIVDDTRGIIYCYIPKVILTWTHTTHNTLQCGHSVTNIVFCRGRAQFGLYL